MPFGTKEFMKLMNLAIWYERFPVRFIQFHQVVKEELHSQKDRLPLNKCIVFLFNGDQILSSPDERQTCVGSSLAS